jgi:polar amino acid transport system substrate-binding protein
VIRFIALLFCCLAAPAVAQGVVIPQHGDPRVRAERPEQAPPRTLRIITDDEYPPLHYADAEGVPAGFAIDLMRAICERLAVTCTIQARRFDTLLQTLAEGQADVVAAAVPVTAQLKTRFDVSRPWHRLVGRFVGREGFDAALIEAGLAGQRVAVVRETAHAAFLAEFFPAARLVEAGDLDAALARLAGGEADLVFGDGQSLALWLGARAGAGFAFRGGPFASVRHFGEPLGFITRADQPNLKRNLDFALQGIVEDGVYARLFLKHFPVSPF